MHYCQLCDVRKILKYSKGDENYNFGETPKHACMLTYFIEKFGSHIRPYAKCSPLVSKWAIYFPKLSWEIHVLSLCSILETMLCVNEFIYCENGRIRLSKLNKCQILKRSVDYRVGLLQNGYLNVCSYPNYSNSYSCGPAVQSRTVSHDEMIGGLKKNQNIYSASWFNFVEGTVTL